VEIKFLSIQARYRVSGSRLYRETRLDVDANVNRPISKNQVGISSGNQALTRGAFIDTNPEVVEIWEGRRLPFVNFARVETQFPNYPIFPRLVLTE
jgi:hypothetical protein